jgi:DNA-binding phage protein
LNNLAKISIMDPALLESLNKHISASGLSKRQVAQRAGVRPELLSRLNSQKACDTKTLHKLADALGLEIVLQAKGAPVLPSKAQRLKLSLPFDWSNPEIPDIALIRKVLEFANLADMTHLALEFGIERLESELQKMPAALTRSAARVLPNIRAALTA